MKAEGVNLIELNMVKKQVVMTLDEFKKLQAKAAKWDMIQSAIENEVMFVDAHNDSINGHQTLTTEDMEYLEKLHKERGAE